jgi:hypothetical protein
MISWGASEGSHINALAAFHDDARYWYFSNLLSENPYSPLSVAFEHCSSAPEVPVTANRKNAMVDIPLSRLQVICISLLVTPTARLIERAVENRRAAVI